MQAHLHQSVFVLPNHGKGGREAGKEADGPVDLKGQEALREVSADAFQQGLQEVPRGNACQKVSALDDVVAPAVHHPPQPGNQRRQKNHAMQDHRCAYREGDGFQSRTQHIQNPEDPLLLGLEFGPRALRNIQHQDLVGDEKDHHGKPGAPCPSPLYRQAVLPVWHLTACFHEILELPYRQIQLLRLHRLPQEPQQCQCH
mmetsp:Transcript_111612/g.266269  ORF Transcript_111612/g.266269 Transcript_111612/m.266269 type:complete len:200 (-) Transcript_111612:405-1004(-)